MKVRSKLKELLVVTATYSLDLVAGLAMNLALPVFVSVETYAVVKVFLLYVTFVSVLNLGFNDGVYVKYGGYDYDELPKAVIRSFIAHVFIQGALFGVLLGVLGVSGGLGIDRAVGAFLGVNLFVLNLNGLYVFINQFTRRFSVNLANNVIAKLVQVALVAVAIVFSLDDPYVLIAAITASNLICLFLNVVKNRDLVQVNRAGGFETRLLIKTCYRSGFAIMVGYYASQLIVSAGQFAVNYTCSTEEFAKFSFAFSIMNFLNVFVNSVSTWLYPTMKRALLRPGFKRWAGAVSVLCTAALLPLLSAGFILAAFVEAFIPKYVGSVGYMLILFPTVMFNGIMKMVLGNLFKACELERSYMLINLAAAGASVVLVALSAVVFPGEAEAVAWATALAIVAQFTLLNVRIWGRMDGISQVVTASISLSGLLGFYATASLPLGYIEKTEVYLLCSFAVALLGLAISRNEVKLLWK